MLGLPRSSLGPLAILRDVLAATGRATSSIVVGIVPAVVALHSIAHDYSSTAIRKSTAQLAIQSLSILLASALHSTASWWFLTGQVIQVLAVWHFDLGLGLSAGLLLLMTKITLGLVLLHQ